MEQLSSNRNLSPDSSSEQAGELNTSTSIEIVAKSKTKPGLIQRLGQMAIVLATAGATSALGLVAALTIPLPGSLFPNDSGPEPIEEILKYGFQYRVSRPVNILVMGIDRVPGAKNGEIFEGRSDTMLLVRVDPKADSVSLLSIPRDTQVQLPNSEVVTKVNDANVRGGALLAAETVSKTLNGIPIDRYVRVSTDAFRELVDALGGVRVFVPEKMSYVDNTQKLKIDLEKGWQTLDGSQAEQFARFRQDAYGDIGRVQRQQTLLKALRDRLMNPTVIPRLPALVNSMQKYIDTNLSLEEMLALVSAGRHISQGDFRLVMLPGRFSQPNEYAASYWIMDPTGRDRVLTQYFGLESDATLVAQSPKLQSLRIAIQNASSKPNIANQLRRQLQEMGFTNTYLTQDWADHQGATELIVQQGDLESAKQLQEMLGFGRINPASVGDLESEITIRVGDDWANRAQPNE